MRCGCCIHTHLSHAHFSAHSALAAYFAHLHACHAWLKCLKFICTCVVSLHLDFSLLMIHPSLSRPLPTTTSLTIPSTRSCSVPASRSLTTWPDQMQTQILSCKTMYCYRKDLPSISTTPELSVKYNQQSQTRKTLRDLHDSHLMGDENCMEETPCHKKNQGSHHTRFLGNLIRIQFVGAS